MSMVDAVRTCLAKYATFSGRARRSEYWWFVLAYVVVSILAAILDASLGTTTQDGQTGLIGGLFGLAVLLPSLAVGARRLHDTGRSGWRLLVMFIPVLGFLLLLVWLTRDSAPSNQWGPNPKVSVPTHVFASY